MTNLSVANWLSPNDSLKRERGTPRRPARSRYLDAHTRLGQSSILVRERVQVNKVALMGEIVLMVKTTLIDRIILLHQAAGLNRDAQAQSQSKSEHHH